MHQLGLSYVLWRAGASIPPLRPWCIFPPVSDFLLFSKKFLTLKKIFTILPFPEKFLDFHPPKFLFLVIDHKFRISPHFSCFSTFPPSVSRKLLFSPLLWQISPSVLHKFTFFLHTMRVFPPTLTMMHLCITQCTYAPGRRSTVVYVWSACDGCFQFHSALESEWPRAIYVVWHHFEQYRSHIHASIWNNSSAFGNDVIVHWPPPPCGRSHAVDMKYLDTWLYRLVWSLLAPVTATSAPKSIFPAVEYRGWTDDLPPCLSIVAIFMAGLSGA